MASPSNPLRKAYFKLRPLENLAFVDKLPSLDPILDANVLKVLPDSDGPQIFAACGRGARSTFRTLQHGLEVEEARCFELPGTPTAIWTVKRTETGASSP